MTLETFGRSLVELLAERALDTLRKTSVDDVRRVMSGHLPSPPASEANGPHVGTTLGAFAIGAAMGAGLAALYTPTSGGELRKKLSRAASGARTQAMALGETVRTAAVGKSNGHVAPRASRAKRAQPSRAHHDA